MDTVLSLLVGLGLAAACGFRVFVPVLVLSIASRAGMATLGSDWQWLSSTPALIALSTASVLEITGYWVPWLDHLLDTIATPAAIIAGSIVAATQMTDLDPMLKWSAAIIAGGGLAGAVQFATVAVRAASTATSGGLANPVVSTTETALAGVASIGAMTIPAFVLISIILALVLARTVVRRRHERRARSSRRPPALVCYSPSQRPSQMSEAGPVINRSRVPISSPLPPTLSEPPGRCSVTGSTANRSNRSVFSPAA